MNSLRLAVALFTVFPIGQPRVDQRAAGYAVSWSPVIGLLLGTIATGSMWLLRHTDLIAGAVAVGLLALLTRGMHFDGLADTFDGLGSYGSPAKARAVMAQGSSGPFGVLAIVVAALTQVLAFDNLAEHQAWLAIGASIAVGRVAVVMACRPGLIAVPDSRFGALVAESQSIALVGIWVLLAAGLGWEAGVKKPLFGLIAVLVSLAVAAGFTAHCQRRLGGVSGDVYGANVEITTALAALGFAWS